MFGKTRFDSFDDVFNFQREMDRVVSQLWNDLPTRPRAAASPSFNVTALEDGWHIDVPMPGIDPQGVSIELAGNNLTIRAEAASEGNHRQGSRYEQTLVIPPFLDLERLSASHRHGMLQLTLPLKESVKPRRIQIDMGREDQRPDSRGVTRPINEHSPV